MRYLFCSLGVAALIAGQASAQALPSIDDAAPRIILDFCVPLVSGVASPNPRRVIEGLGAEAVEPPPDVWSDARYLLATSDAGEVQLDIREGGCILHYVGDASGVNQVAAALTHAGWDSRVAMHGLVWRKSQLYAVTAFASETTDGPFEGWAYVVREDDPIGSDLAEWFSDQDAGVLASSPSHSSTPSAATTPEAIEACSR